MSQNQPPEFRAAEASQKNAVTTLYVIDHAGTFYHLTNYDVPLTVEGLPGDRATDPQEFEPAPGIDDERPDQTTETKQRTANLIVPVIDGEFRKLFVTAAPKASRLWIYRVNRQALPGTLDATKDIQLEFVGRANGVAFRSDAIVAQFVADVLQDDRSILRYTYQNQCNHPLYGFGCGVKKELYQWTGNVSAADRINRVVRLAIATMPDGTGAAQPVTEATFEGGYLKQNGTSNLVGVISGRPISGDVALYLQWWPPGLAAGSNVTAFKGCPHLMAACQSEFNNLSGQRATVGNTPTILYDNGGGIIGYSYPVTHGGGNYMQMPKVKLDGVICEDGVEVEMDFSRGSVTAFTVNGPTAPTTIEFPRAGGFGATPFVPKYNPATDGVSQ